MRIFIIVLFLYCLNTFAQTEDVIWLQNEAIKIEDVNPNTPLQIFKDKAPQNFIHAKIFGFGEATHHGKEFFDVKAKYFKYLVENHGVRVFILEDSFISEAGINEWISGGNGSRESVANHFTLAPWYCKEVVDLLEWIRGYNSNKHEVDQIRYYGMDMQEVTKIDVLIKNIATKNQLNIPENLLTALTACANKKIEYQNNNTWADIQLPLLVEIEEIFKNHPIQNDDIKLAIRALSNLKMYTNYVQNNYSQNRDFWMFENVKWIVKNMSNNGKAFIWAHNEHINFKGFGNYSNRKIYNLGKHLKAYYQDDYYAVGFDFEKGTLGGFTNQDQKMKWQLYPINQAFANTYAATLAKAKEEVFFIEINKNNTESFKFFNKKQLQLTTGGPGYQPNRNNLFAKKYAEMYDALIFIKNISLSTNIFDGK